MKKKENLCKFVSAIFEKPLKTINFVYETNNVFSEKTIKKSHAIYLVSQGRGRLCGDGDERHIETGSVCFTFADTPFFIKDEGDLQYMYIS